ncbi:MAG TPA: Spy/CpxP family protein refolding chaperone [Blastocatellia bacterium]|nr:Spy/CpxP family protein refolding chaperone [Blastocatellia bacterium]
MKKVNRIKSVIAALVLAVAIAVPVVIAQSTDEGGRKGRRDHSGHFGKRGGGMGRIFSQLDLTDAQKAQIKQIHENSREELRPLVQEIRAKRQEIRQARQGGTVDEAFISQKLAEMAPLEAKMIAARARIHEQTLAVLTPEQRTKLEQMREQFKSRRGERKARKQTTSL